MRWKQWFIVFFAASLLSAHAPATRVVIESRVAHTSHREASMSYEKIIVYGELDPQDRHNAIIQDIRLAPRNEHGMVEYAATVTLIKPVNMRESSGLLLYEVVNRGASIVPKDYRDGDVFLSSGWQGDIPFRGKSIYGTEGETIQAPTAHNPDGSSITGPILLRFQPDGVANPLLVYDLGDQFLYNDLSGVVEHPPPTVRTVIPAVVPRVDDDGNEVGGIHTVLQQPALGTYLGWNVTASGFSKGQYCSLWGGYIPFSKTKAERMAHHDPRISIEERYGTQRGYLRVVSRAADDLVKRRLLLAPDTLQLVHEATASDVLPSDQMSNLSARHIADEQCHSPEPLRRESNSYEK